MVVAKRLTHPQEVQTLLTMVKNGNVEPEWTTLLGKLRTNEAALLPGAEEAEGKLRRFTLLPRLTPHVRHRAKYFEVQLAGGQEFVFTDHGKTIGPPARSLKEFVSLLVSIPVASLGEHARRGDFSHGLRMCSTTIAWHRTFEKSNSAIGSVISTTCVQRWQNSFRSATDYPPDEGHSRGRWALRSALGTHGREAPWFSRLNLSLLLVVLPVPFHSVYRLLDSCWISQVTMAKRLEVVIKFVNERYTSGNVQIDNLLI